MRKNVLKKYLRLLLLVLTLPLLLSFSPKDKPDGRVSMIARITELSERITVEVIECPYTSGVHIVHTPRETRYLDEDGSPISRTALALGDTVRIRYSGQVMLSSPPQIVAAEITRLGAN